MILSVLLLNRDGQYSYTWPYNVDKAGKMEIINFMVEVGELKASVTGLLA